MAWETEASLPFVLSRDVLIGRAIPGNGELRVPLTPASVDGRGALKMVGGLAFRSAAHSGW